MFPFQFYISLSFSIHVLRIFFKLYACVNGKIMCVCQWIRNKQLITDHTRRGMFVLRFSCFLYFCSKDSDYLCMCVYILMIWVQYHRLPYEDSYEGRDNF